MAQADRAYMYEPRRPPPRPNKSGRGNGRWIDPRVLAVLLSVLGTGALIAVQFIDRFGIPSLGAPIGPVLSFPGTGDVFVTKYADLSHGQSQFSVTVPPTDRYNYVVMLIDDVTGHAVMAIYCRSGDTTAVPVPIGSFRIRVASGMDWYGMTELFGSDTHVEEVVPILTTTATKGAGIDFLRRPNGNLPTKVLFKSGFPGGA